MKTSIICWEFIWQGYDTLKEHAFWNGVCAQFHSSEIFLVRQNPVPPKISIFIEVAALSLWWRLLCQHKYLDLVPPLQEAIQNPSKLQLIDLVSRLLAKSMNSRGLIHSILSKTNKAFERCCADISRKGKCQNLHLSTSLKVWGFQAPNATAQLCLKALLREIKALHYKLLRTDAIRKRISLPGNFRPCTWWDTMDNHTKYIGNLAKVKW